LKNGSYSNERRHDIHAKRSKIRLYRGQELNSLTIRDDKRLRALSDLSAFILEHLEHRSAAAQLGHQRKKLPVTQ
jgi:hypothetical protein